MASKVDSSGLSVISEERVSARKHHDSNDDCEYVYSQKSRNSHGGGQKKKVHPLMLGPSRQSKGNLVSFHAASKNNLSDFTQRIMSAKLLRVKQVQNQLTETQIQLNELINENRILRNLQKRQEGALKRYEGNQAELPQLIRSHNEEIRTLKANNKIIKAQLKECNTKLKERENELESLRDSYNKLKRLSTEKNLLEREKLQKKVEELQEVIKEQEEKIQVLSRKALLESKNYRHHLNIEVMKHKETQKDLNSALSMISKLESQLMAKEKALPGGKLMMKRDNKYTVPIIANKSIDFHSKVSDDNFLSRDDLKGKMQLNDSPESELEILNGIGSSDDTPSPTNDIFPDIRKSTKESPKMEVTTEITSSKLDMFQLNCDLPNKQYSALKSRKTPLPKRNSRFSADIESNARAIAEKLNEDMETIDDLVQKVDEKVGSENKDRLGSLYEEVKSSASKLETEINSQLSSIYEKPDEEEDVKTKEPMTRTVPKRKLNEEIENFSELEMEENLTEVQQEKLVSMTKTWNDIKNKIREDRIKAEEKIKELTKMNHNNSDSTHSFEESEKPEESNMEESTPEESIPEDDVKRPEGVNQDLRFVNFTDDAYILRELEKTDKVFNKLRNRNSLQKSNSSSSTDKKSKISSGAKQQQSQQQNIKTFRTESQRDPKYLDEFQTEYQKQNLLKALKAIDVGKDPNISTEDSEGSDSESKKEKVHQKNGLKHIKRLSGDKSNKDLMTELFGSKHNKIGKNEHLKV